MGLETLAAAKILSAQPNLNVVEYLTPGTYSLALPIGVNQIWVDAAASGGGGGGSITGGGGGGGGSGGAFSKQHPVRIPLGVSSIAIVIPAGGAGGAGGASATNGVDGEDLIISAGANTLLSLTRGRKGKVGLTAAATKNGGDGGSSTWYVYGTSAGGTGSGVGAYLASGATTPHVPGVYQGASGGGGGGLDAGVGGAGAQGGYSLLGSDNALSGAGGANAGGGGGGASYPKLFDGFAGTYGTGGAGGGAPGVGVTATLKGAGGGGGGTGMAGGAGAPGFARICW